MKAPNSNQIIMWDVKASIAKKKRIRRKYVNIMIKYTRAGFDYWYDLDDLLEMKKDIENKPKFNTEFNDIYNHIVYDHN